MWLILLAALAQGADKGGGLYAEVSGGGGWTNRLGPLIRSPAIRFNLGGYAGKFAGSYRFGQYWRFGASVASIPIFGRSIGRDEDGNYVRTREFLEDMTSATLEFGRGVDMMNLGVWWTVEGGLLWLDDSNDFTPLPSDADALGGMASGTVAVAYNLGRSFSVSLRITFGADFVVDTISMRGGVGFGLLFRAPVVPVGRHDRKRTAAGDAIEDALLNPDLEEKVSTEDLRAFEIDIGSEEPTGLFERPADATVEPEAPKPVQEGAENPEAPDFEPPAPVPTGDGTEPGPAPETPAPE